MIKKLTRQKELKNWRTIHESKKRKKERKKEKKQQEE